MFNLDFTSRFSQLLEERGLTAYGLAKASGLNERIVGHWKAGERYPSTENLVKLANFFGVSTDYLLGQSDDPHGHAVDSAEVIEIIAQKGRPLDPDQERALKEALKTLSDKLHKLG